MSMIRAFIALDMPEAVQAGLGEIQARLRETGASVKWVKPDRIHLTLKFLGNVPQETLPQIAAALEAVASRTAPFRLRPEGCGAFPSLNQMRVIWVGLRGEEKILDTLQREVEEAVLPLGFPKEDRPFKPHLTLGRVKGRQRLRSLQESLRAHESFAAEAFDVKELVLYKSDLRPEGAHYTPLYRAEFQM